MLQELLRWPEKLQQGHALAEHAVQQHKNLLLGSYEKIAFVGMGGSGIAGRIFKTFLDQHTAYTTIVVDSPLPPAAIDQKTLTFVISYSGNTWESLDAFVALAKRGVPLVAISHGGQLEDLAKKNGIAHVALPSSAQPRTALGVFMGFFAQLFAKRGVAPFELLLQTWHQVAATLVGTYQNKDFFARPLALLASRDIFHVWGVSDSSAAAAYRAATQFNENAKIQTGYASFPELAHNLLVGFERFANSPLVFWYEGMLQSENMNRAIQSLLGILRDSGVDLYKIPVFGDTFGSQFFSMILWTDFASFYLGQERGVDTQRVRIIEELKQRQQSNGIFVEV